MNYPFGWLQTYLIYLIGDGAMYKRRFIGDNRRDWVIHRNQGGGQAGEPGMKTMYDDLQSRFPGRNRNTKRV